MEGFYWRSLVFLEILQQCLFPTVWWQHSKTSKLGVPWTRFSLHRLYLCYTLQLGWILMVERTMQFHCPFWMINSVCIYIYVCVLDFNHWGMEIYNLGGTPYCKSLQCPGCGQLAGILPWNGCRTQSWRGPPDGAMSCWIGMATARASDSFSSCYDSQPKWIMNAYGPIWFRYTCLRSKFMLSSRNALAKNFWYIERSPRYLCLD